MNCIIIDDEELARDGLTRYVDKVDFLHLVGSCENAIQATQTIKGQDVDLMFLDIQMPHLSGIEFLKGLSHPPMVIFHTAFPNFALESYQLDVIDYLVKPITFDRFHKAVSKAYEYHQLRQSGGINSSETPRDYLFIKCDTRYEKVVFSQVMYVEAMQNYSVIQTTEGKLTTLTSLKNMEALLPPAQFMRVHKSYIIALSRVETIDGNQVKIGQKMVPLSKNVRDEVMRRLMPGR